MRIRAPFWMILTLLIASCVDWSSALFLKGWKKSKGYGGGYGYSGYGNSGYGNYGSYGNYAGGYGYGYPSYQSYEGGYRGGRRPNSGQRKGRTYSEIARVLKPDGYVGLGGSRFLPRTPFSVFWG
ncbi:glycine-rich cell wall structural protein [Drosophila subobscura]|uniref:glycine-rich cell wall structural protein n=1 Tax=Drosophila subobscura TaxID=7241 RepID=UPI00155A0CA6|nr:glycine-rich cell wall structural protein [Drosophila subobscura]